MILSELQIRSIISDAMDKLQQELSIHSQLKAYMNESKEDLIQRVANAAKYNSLQSIIIIKKEAPGEKSIVIFFNEEARMSDVHLRRVLQDIMTCESKEDKVKLILTNFKSLHDYLDMLESDCLYGDEYDALFLTFGDMELAILAKTVFYEELRNELMNFPSILLLGNEYPIEWQLHFVQSLHRLSHERLLAIEKYMEEMDYEQMKFY